MLNPNVHRTLMLTVLKQLYGQPLLASRLGFKGGTAAYLLYQLPRFSVDLDFDLLDLAAGDAVFGAVGEILLEHGDLEERTMKQNTLFFLLGYQKGLQKLKVEISKLAFGSSFEPKQHLGIPLLVMAKPDMFAHKLVALLERRQLASRDLFDVHYFLSSGWRVNTQMVEKRTGMNYQVYIRQVLGVIEQTSSQTLLTGIGELIDQRQKDWIKKSLKIELLSLLQIHLDGFKN